jgi:ribosomal protein S18 acetylase RimI-like enzyme
MTVGLDVRVRPAVLADQRQIANLMHFSLHVHRHLDWRYPLDWLGSPPFFVIEDQGQISAALACPPDPPQIGWVRLFVNAGQFPLEQAWDTLWEVARKDLARRPGFVVAAIVLQGWYTDLLVRSGFTSRQAIVMLERDDPAPAASEVPVGMSLRPLMPYDLPEVAWVDAAAFEPLWQNSLASLERAYPQAVLASVAELDGRIVGYQISTRNPLGAHLARLAVRPEVQGHGVGHALVADLVGQAARRGMQRLTVNTQSDNTASLALYRSLGFRETGERYPVYQIQVQPGGAR